MIIIWKCEGSRDDTGAIAKTLERKYLTGLQLGNFTEMMPGLIDVNLFRLLNFFAISK